MRPDPDATVEGKAARLEADNAALSRLVEEQQMDLERARAAVESLRSTRWWRLGRRLGLVRDGGESGGSGGGIEA